MLEKKRANEKKYDYESLLHRTIENFIYEDFYKTSTSVTSEEKQLEISELEKCLSRQHERALTRLITYQFIKKFLSNVLNIENNDQCLKILLSYLPYLKKTDLEWSYFDDIQASNNHLKEGISDTYYSIIKLVLSSSLQSPLLVKNIFYLLNLSYESTDLCRLYNHQFIETLFALYVSFIAKSERNTSLDLKLTAFNWFRLFVFQIM